MKTTTQTTTQKFDIKADDFAGRVVFVIVANGRIVTEDGTIVRFTSRDRAHAYALTHVEN